MFADVEGFTAWSSVREPSQVFTLLETLYAEFDRVAMQRRVFKVETVGDCYVAVCGLPEPNQDHAVTMARFARDCIVEHTAAVKTLESTLGPETGDLRLRVGLHSGPITAGVLRGERSRFQLFGDTVNTASRLESAGVGNRVHLSSTTADLITSAGYERWIKEREGIVTLKGKGSMQTYWLLPRKKDAAKSGNTNSQVGRISEKTYSFETDSLHDAKTQRLIAFNADALIRVIKQIVAQRGTTILSEARAPVWHHKHTTPLTEVVEVIELPLENKAAVHVDLNTLVLDPKVTELVYKYVSCLASKYPDNPFHNFKHASHVTMSVTKLLSRIVAPSDMDFTDNAQASAKLHDHTYGITSDPLTQFACILSALIHDVDHPGVSNATLVAEGNELMKVYGDKSLAEQNSVDQAWDLLMTQEYQPLVALLCRDELELSRLRQLVVNCVMATDIMDPDLKELRNRRWGKAFHDDINTNLGETTNDTSREVINRKATIVIEHLIQASDVAHTMQHWNVYTKWNARLFKEMYKAYREGHDGAKDPSEFWVKGEIGFFDFYIIPLANKLKDCGVFGVSSDEYLQYAISNRNEWEEKGQAMTEQFIKEVREEYGGVAEKA
jgi:class 3 adenylate cyclase